jgi:hypothetical protein
LFKEFCRLYLRLRAALLCWFSLSFTTCFGLHGHLEVCRILHNNSIKLTRRGKHNLQNPLTPWSWALLERSQVVWLLDSFQAFYGTRRFNTKFTRALHLSLSWARLIQSSSPLPTSTRSILILSNHLRLSHCKALLLARNTVLF